MQRLGRLMIASWDLTRVLANPYFEPYPVSEIALCGPAYRLGCQVNGQSRPFNLICRLSPSLTQISRSSAKRTRSIGSCLTIYSHAKNRKASQCQLLTAPEAYRRRLRVPERDSSLLTKLCAKKNKQRNFGMCASYVTWKARSSSKRRCYSAHLPVAVYICLRLCSLHHTHYSNVPSRPHIVCMLHLPISFDNLSAPAFKRYWKY